jgi:hypothetical protein
LRIGLYLNPPAHAAVFCVDEKTAIQALDRKDRMLPLSPGRAESHGFEYKRNGTLGLFAALNTATGQVLGKTVPRHTSALFVAIFTDPTPDAQCCRCWRSSRASQPYSDLGSTGSVNRAAWGCSRTHTLCEVDAP